MFEISDISVIAVEPVTLAEQKEWSILDADYALEDGVISDMITTSRIMLEKHLNVGFVRRNVRLIWDGKTMQLPLSPNGSIISVSKDDNGDVTALTTDDYRVSAYSNKTISINDSSFGDANYFYDINGAWVDITMSRRNSCIAYTCEYATGYESGALPINLKTALRIQTDWMIKTRGMPEHNTLSGDALRAAGIDSKNLILNG